MRERVEDSAREREGEQRSETKSERERGSEETANPTCLEILITHELLLLLKHRLHKRERGQLEQEMVERWTGRRGVSLLLTLSLPLPLPIPPRDEAQDLAISQEYDSGGLEGNRRGEEGRNGRGDR